MHNFRKLKVYERAIAFTTRVYRLTRGFPAYELYGLSSQLRRASSSMALNIAEGSGNNGSREFARFLGFSIRSGYECIACIDIARNVEIVRPQEAELLIKEIEEIISMLVGLQRSLRKR